MPRSSSVRVRDVMTSPAVSVTPETSIGDLVGVFERHDFHVIPVVSGDRDLVGVVSKVDVLRLLAADSPFADRRVRDMALEDVGSIMRRNPVTIEPIAAAEDAWDLMAQEHLPGVPVVTRTSGRHVLTGMICRSDLRVLPESGSTTPGPSVRRRIAARR